MADLRSTWQQLQKKHASGGARARRIGSRAPTLDARAGLFDPARLCLSTMYDYQHGLRGRRQFLNLAAGTAAVPGRISLAWSQTYPTRPVHWIVSFSEGGPNDIVARL